MKCIKDGCKASAMKKAEYCYFHNPESADKRKEGQANGGRRGRGAYAPIGDCTLENLKGVLWSTLGELRHSKSELVSRARAIASVSSVLITVINESSLESRIQALERRFEKGLDNDYLDEGLDHEYENEANR